MVGQRSIKFVFTVTCSPNSLTRKGHQFCLQTVKSIGCVLCSNVTVSVAVGWNTQLPVCSVWVPWLSGPKAIFSCGQGCALVSMSSRSGRTNSKASNTPVCGLDSRQPPGQTGPLGALLCRLQTISFGFWTQL